MADLPEAFIALPGGFGTLEELCYDGIGSGEAPTRTISASGKKRIAAAARARWAKFRAAKKKAA